MPIPVPVTFLASFQMPTFRMPKFEMPFQLSKWKEKAQPTPNNATATADARLQDEINQAKIICKLMRYRPRF